MIRGLMWLPLLALFFGLAWAGWNEYQKLEAYKVWATQFERAKYDIYAALGQQGNRLTWGLPTRNGVVQTEQLDLNEVAQLAIEVDSKAIDPTQLPNKGRFALGFELTTGQHFSIPFTQGDMARQWYDFLCQTYGL